MAVALDNLSKAEGRKMALLGDMRELGADAAAEHSKVVETLRQSAIEALLVGEEFTRAAEGSGIRCFATSDELAAWLQENPLQGCTVLVKGSRGTRMEKVLPAL